MDNRVLYKDLVIGETYWFLQVGHIREIVIVDFDEEKAYTENDSGQRIDNFLADMGVYDAPKGSYKNDTNMLFAKLDNALDMQESIEYRLAMANHRNRMDWIFSNMPILNPTRGFGIVEDV